MYTSASTPYQRAAIFPWGKKNQEWDGEKCVSERAIKHLHGLMALAAAAEVKTPNWRFKPYTGPICLCVSWQSPGRTTKKLPNSPVHSLTLGACTSQLQNSSTNYNIDQ
jgi:hypothetical protein